MVKRRRVVYKECWSLIVRQLGFWIGNEDFMDDGI